MRVCELQLRSWVVVGGGWWGGEQGFDQKYQRFFEWDFRSWRAEAEDSGPRVILEHIINDLVCCVISWISGHGWRAAEAVVGKSTLMKRMHMLPCLKLAASWAVVLCVKDIAILNVIIIVLNRPPSPSPLLPFPLDDTGELMLPTLDYKHLTDKIATAWSKAIQDHDWSRANEIQCLSRENQVLSVKETHP